MTTVLEALKSAQFVVDASGNRVAVQLSPELWEALLTWLENVEPTPTVELSELHSTATDDTALISAAIKLSEPSLATVWNNPEDDVYDAL